MAAQYDEERAWNEYNTMVEREKEGKKDWYLNKNCGQNSSRIWKRVYWHHCKDVMSTGEISSNRHRNVCPWNTTWYLRIHEASSLFESWMDYCFHYPESTHPTSKHNLIFLRDPLVGSIGSEWPWSCLKIETSNVYTEQQWQLGLDRKPTLTHQDLQSSQRRQLLLSPVN